MMSVTTSNKEKKTFKLTEPKHNESTTADASLVFFCFFSFFCFFAYIISFASVSVD